MTSLNPIQENRVEVQNNLHKGFAEGTGIADNPGQTVSHRAMVAGRISESLEKGLDVHQVATTHNVLTPQNAGTIGDIAELIKGGQWEFYGRNDIVNYQTELRKSLDTNELSYSDWQENLRKVNQMQTTIVKALDDTDVQVWFRPKQVTANDLSKSIDYKERLEKMKKRREEPEDDKEGEEDEEAKETK